MPDGLTAHPPPATHEPIASEPGHERRPPWVAAALQAVVTVLVFVVVGAGCGWLWNRVWDAPSGVVSNHQWFTNEAGLRADFEGVAWYVTIALVAGLVLGALAAWLSDRSELVTLAAVLVGSVLAAYLMLRVGVHLSPPDPHELAKTAQDGEKLKGALHLDSWPPRTAFPFGALLGLAFVYLLTVGRSSREPRPEHTAEHMAEPTAEPTAEPLAEPTAEPTAEPPEVSAPHDGPSPSVER
jgi:hypothetical protein